MMAYIVAVAWGLAVGVCGAAVMALTTWVILDLAGVALPIAARYITVRQSEGYEGGQTKGRAMIEPAEIKAIRLARGETQEEFGSAVFGRLASTVSNWERGVFPPTRKAEKRIRALDPRKPQTAAQR